MKRINRKSKQCPDKENVIFKYSFWNDEKKLKLTRQNAKVFNTSVNLSILPKKIRAGEWESCFYSSKKGTGAKGQTHMGRVAENVCQESPVP